jgi:hypothetical protein
VTLLSESVQRSTGGFYLSHKRMDKLHFIPEYNTLILLTNISNVLPCPQVEVMKKKEINDSPVSQRMTVRKVK